MTTTFDSIPIVDIGGLSSPEPAERQRVATLIGDAARDVGFLYITNHGVPQSLLDDLLHEAKRFFALPVEERGKLHIRNSLPFLSHKGYVPRGEEFFDHNNKDGKPPPPPDNKDAFDIGREFPAGHPLIDARKPMMGHNQWPEESQLPSFKATSTKYYDAVNALGRRFFSVGLTRALGLEEGSLDFILSDHCSTGLRLMHYPFSETTCDVQGISPHTDYQLLTMLFGTAPGLEVLNADGKWVDAPPVPGAFVVNTADLLEVLTAGRFVATKHRVRPVSEERYSFPMFWGADYDTIIKPLPQFAPSNLDGDNEQQRESLRKYPQMKIGDYVWDQLIQTHHYLVDAVKRGEIEAPKESQKPGTYGRVEAEKTTGEARG